MSQPEPGLAEKYGFRDGLVDALVRDLVGPADGPDEVITELPLDRYIAGVLWPSEEATQVAPEPDSADTADSDGDDDTPIAQALMRYPSSLGMTFTVDLSRASTVEIRVHAASYVPSVDTDEESAGASRLTRRRRAARPKSWQRTAAEPEPVPLDVTDTGTRSRQVSPGLELFTYVRQPRDHTATVSVAIRNTRRPARGQLRDAFAWFQAGIGVSTSALAIIDRTAHHAVSEIDADLRSAALLYRNTRVFATGHGCATRWIPTTEPLTARVWTTVIPRYEVARARPGQLPPDIDLRMSTLAEADDEGVKANLRGVLAAYRKWIDSLATNLNSDAADVEQSLRKVAQDHIAGATEAADRIEAGIELLSDPTVMKAFRLTNAAMQAQRARQDWVRAGASGEVGDGAEQRWHPFQIAYIMLNLPGLADHDHPDRGIADLLWFPTGGGKTEAYLGLVAFSVLHRRLLDSEAMGVSVIMRYTLRLLTIQQFERATMLMCSLEHLRTSRRDLGDRPFAIGLWVGRGATPNTLTEARRSLRDLQSGKEISEKNPIQLRQCPWCGADLDHTNYSVLRPPQQGLRIACGAPTCDFRDGLPAYVVDEDIYRVRPELLLGTVDKFAMMAWNENVRALFARDGIGSPPSLIIQDELHLIAGPLGSIVGLYETAVDAACGVQAGETGPLVHRPKVIASTATIRRADRQIKTVFNRAARQFPPPGIDPDSSFFAEPAPREHLATREYVGVMAPGTSHATLLVRTYAALLQAAADIDGPDGTRDPYWTLLGYFNSLRVLGSANLMVEGDVRDRLELLARRTGVAARKLRPANELTSRVPSAEIPERLKGLEKTLPSGAADDVVLATNMISVGVDIDRLGLMAVMGQPQSSAEYIQATSRVGRRHPGLVVTLFNSARSRDRSHYENFIPYHQALYRAVEATSATPFAARARDRALHGVLVALVRLLVDALSAGAAAHQATAHPDALRQAALLLEERVAAVAGEEEHDTTDQLEALIDVWLDEATAKPNMRYQNSSNPEAALLVQPEVAISGDRFDYSMHHTPWPTLQSMRDVDAESGLYQIPARGRSK